MALAGSYLLLIAAPSRLTLLVGVPACLGVFFAATDGVLAALTSHVVPGAARTTGLAVVGVVVAGGRAVAAIGFGAIWLRSGPHTALLDALAALLVAAGAATWVLRPLMRPERSANGGGPPGPGVSDSAATGPAADSPVTPVHSIEEIEGGREDGRRLVVFAAIAALCLAGTIWAVATAVEHTRAASAASSAHLGTISPKQTGGVTDPTPPFSPLLGRGGGPDPPPRDRHRRRQRLRAARSRRHHRPDWGAGGDATDVRGAWPRPLGEGCA